MAHVETLKPQPRQIDADPSLWQRLSAARTRSLDLVSTLSPEDMTVQAEDDASPTKWHLAHVTWFFEEFVLKPFLKGYRGFDERFNYCFNSYYEALGTASPEAKAGLAHAPQSRRVLAYRAHVDDGLERLVSSSLASDVRDLIELGLNHEQQHQELILTDILALFAANPLRPAYRPLLVEDGGGRSSDLPKMRWIAVDGGIYTVGDDGAAGFAWDNERPCHDVLLRPFAIADRLVTNGDWLQFMVDEGYATSSLWLSDGWATVVREGWQAPRYWELVSDEWHEMKLAGSAPVDPAAAVSHVSYYEAEAFARWSGHRLPTEFEWEIAASAATRDEVRGLFGDVWQWTCSAYLPYPGYAAPTGAVGEYNGKFMVGQHVVRGSSRATPDGHSRPTYRNFFHPHQRWQFTGVRLAAEAM